MPSKRPQKIFSAHLALPIPRRTLQVQEFEEGKHRELAVIKDQRLQGLVDSRKETLAERKR